MCSRGGPWCTEHIQETSISPLKPPFQFHSLLPAWSSKNWGGEGKAEADKIRIFPQKLGAAPGKGCNWSLLYILPAKKSILPGLWSFATMETTRSPFRQIIHYRIPFAFLVLFTRGVFATTVTVLSTNSTPATLDTTSVTKNGNETGNTTATVMPTSALVMTISESTFTPSTKHSQNLSSSSPSTKTPVVTQVAKTHGKKTSALKAAATTPKYLHLPIPTNQSHTTKEPGLKPTTDASDLNRSKQITAKQKTIDTQTDAATPSGTNATTAIPSATAVVKKAHSTSGASITSSKITPTSKSWRHPGSKGPPGPSTVTGEITTPVGKEREKTPDLSHDHGNSETGETTAAPGTTAPSGQQSKNVIVIIVIVLFFLLVLVLVACLYCRRRRRSGSTSFNPVEWAGRAALPDDSGLDKDVEQGPLATGDREARRPTLTTFFGKRQSRVASVAMEEIDGKEREEAQQLIDGNAGRDSRPQGASEANGKVREPTQEENK
ncbi:leukosialin [Tiliqua scincoides]|uniref:leukosialin n=1 Tax=Tiliqua scincoides TaxID=71010 RepID=UPI003461E8C0